MYVTLSQVKNALTRHESLFWLFHAYFLWCAWLAHCTSMVWTLIPLQQSQHWITETNRTTKCLFRPALLFVGDGGHSSHEPTHPQQHEQNVVDVSSVWPGFVEETSHFHRKDLVIGLYFLGFSSESTRSQRLKYWLAVHICDLGQVIWSLCCFFICKSVSGLPQRCFPK